MSLPSGNPIEPTKPEAVELCHKGFDPDGVLFIAADGKVYRYKMNRKAIFTLAAQCFTALANMEPGEWRRAHEEAA
jgi:hypothetical protein